MAVEKKKSTAKIDLSGRAFDYLTVKNESYHKNKRTYWLCQCVCGVEKYLSYTSLVHKKSTKSCGCKKLQIIKEKNTTHGARYLVEYTTWCSMKQRCCNSNQPHYKSYGGRGIQVCDEWFNSFDTFYKDMGKKPSKLHSLGRIDNNKGYSPENCRWETEQEQIYNKQATVVINYNGAERPLGVLLEELGISNKEYIYKRIRKGMDPKKAIEKPYFKIPTYNIYGEELTARQIEDKYKIKRDTFGFRLNLGWTPEEAATKPKHYKKIGKPSPHRSIFIVFGEELDSVALEKKYQIKGDVFKKRLKRGWTPEDAATLPLASKLKKSS